MSRRLELHDIFIDILGTRGQPKSRVYFQPPATVKMEYPCIVYKRIRVSPLHADNRLYRHMMGYMVTVIDPNPDSEIPDRILNLPLSRHDRYYTADNLNHDVFNVYY